MYSEAFTNSYMTGTITLQWQVYSIRKTKQWYFQKLCAYREPMGHLLMIHIDPLLIRALSVKVI